MPASLVRDRIADAAPPNADGQRLRRVPSNR
jgi:hypothetical protein